MEFLDGSWKKEVSSWDALMGEELLNQERQEISMSD